MGRLHPKLINTRYTKRLTNKGLEEHKVLDGIENRFLPIRNLPENIKSIFIYAFSEMLNNAIEHSLSKFINVEIGFEDDNLFFIISDFGVGVFRNIMKKLRLASEIEAVQEILKGKTTTAPSLHSGEGIFFTSKVGDKFVLDSFGQQFIADNTIPDIFIKNSRGHKRGTKVSFCINVNKTGHLNDIFRQFTSESKNSIPSFNKTEIHVRLFALGEVHISRSQARRILAGLEKFKAIRMDYAQVPMVGQAFADEIYRVFRNKHPDIRIEDSNMNDAVKFMVDRAKA
jgi:anti-sigma regulatory factor (Ser/Thr protein kinase)